MSPVHESADDPAALSRSLLEPARDLYASWGAFGLGLTVTLGVALVRVL